MNLLLQVGRIAYFFDEKLEKVIGWEGRFGSEFFKNVITDWNEGVANVKDPLIVISFTSQLQSKARFWLDGFINGWVRNFRTG